MTILRIVINIVLTLRRTLFWYRIHWSILFALICWFNINFWYLRTSTSIQYHFILIHSSYFRCKLMLHSWLWTTSLPEIAFLRFFLILLHVLYTFHFLNLELVIVYCLLIDILLVVASFILQCWWFGNIRILIECTTQSSRAK